MEQGDPALLHLFYLHFLTIQDFCTLPNINFFDKKYGTTITCLYPTEKGKLGMDAYYKPDGNHGYHRRRARARKPDCGF